MAISTMDQLVAALATAQQIPFHRGTSFNPDASFLSSGALYYPRDGVSNRVVGFPGISPLTAYTRESSLAITGGPAPLPAGHSIIPMNNPSGGNKLYVGALSVGANQPGLLMLVDVICAYRNKLTPDPASPINPAGFAVPGSGPRNYNGGVGVQVFVEQTNTMFAGPLTLTYTNSNNDGGRTSAASSWPFTATGEQNVLYRIGLAPGDRGIRSVQQFSWTGGGGGGNAGLGLLMVRPILTVPVSTQTQVYDFTELGLPEVADNAALQTIFQPSDSTRPINYSGNLTLIEG